MLFGVLILNMQSEFLYQAPFFSNITFCVHFKPKIRHTVKYPKVPSVIRPLAHSTELPIPTAPLSWSLDDDDDDDDNDDDDDDDERIRLKKIKFSCGNGFSDH